MDTHVRRGPTDAAPSRRTVGIDVGGTKTLGLLVEHGPAGVVVVDRERVPSRAGDPSAVDAVVGVARTLTGRSRNQAGEVVPVAAVGVGPPRLGGPAGRGRAAPNPAGLARRGGRGRPARAHDRDRGKEADRKPAPGLGGGGGGKNRRDYRDDDDY